MQTRQRLTGLKKWIYTNLCEGREMKAPAADIDIGEIVTVEPKVYLAWAPSRMDKTGFVQYVTETDNVVPGIIVMPAHANIKYMEEKRFDRYNNIHRPKELGQQLAVNILFGVYEPGIRLPGFVDSVGEKGQGLDMSLLLEATEEGLFTLTDWMDECSQALLRDKSIPGTDLFLDEEKATYSLYTDQAYVVDRRPLYYGFINVTFGCYAEEGVDSVVNDLLN